MSDTKLKVGDRLWFVPSARYHGVPEEYEVRSVGRKWAGIAPPHWKNDRYRIDKNTLVAHSSVGSSPGQAYRDRDAYEATQEADRAWSDFRRQIDRSLWNRPSHLTASDIAEIQARITGSPQ